MASSGPRRSRKGGAARRVGAKAPPEDARGAQGVGPGGAAGGIAPASQAITITVQQQQRQGPWYTCGLGGGLRAEHAVLFGVLVALSYAVGVWVLFWLVMLLLLQSASEACAVACTCESGSGSGGGGCGPCGGCGDSEPSGGGGCCGDSEPSGGGSGGGQEAPGLGVGAGVGALAAASLARRSGWRLPSLSHHPDHPDFRADVFTLAGRRLCVGCFTLYPVFLAASALLVLAPVGGAWGWWLAGGLALAGAQGFSSLGRARRRWVKVAVKSALGLGLAAAVHGVLSAPWRGLVQAGALAVLLGLGSLSALPRRRRMAAWHGARRAAP